ncbi:MAG: type II secretion system F family protein [Bifidobacteriaceae bacterium]|nr:type II secretion system F family protein [Bifidobacteriaceae bacterium]
MALMLYLDVLALILLISFPFVKSFRIPDPLYKITKISAENLLENLIAELKNGRSIQKALKQELLLDYSEIDYQHFLTQLQRRLISADREVLAGLLANVLNMSYRVSVELGTNLIQLLEVGLKQVEYYRAQKILVKKVTAGPKTTSVVLMCLPLFGIGMGYLLGQNLLLTYIDGGTGTVIFVIGIGFLVLGKKITDKMIRNSFPDSSFISVGPPVLDESFGTGVDEIGSIKAGEVGPSTLVDQCFILELVAVCLRAGTSIVRTLACVGRSWQSNPELSSYLINVSTSLKHGDTWEQAWHQVPMSLQGLENCLELGFKDGQSVDARIHGYIEQIQNAQELDLNLRGEKLGVKILLPLGLCYLPSFITLSLIPLIIALVQL